MRSLQLLVVGITVFAVSLFVGAVPAFADNGPHVKGASPIADSCAGCHRAHTAQAASILRQSQPGLCMTCHGSSATGANTDVEDGVGYSGSDRSGGPAGALRGGGFSYALIDSANPVRVISPDSATVPVRGTGAAVTSTHSVDYSNQTAWGNGAIGSGAGTTIQLRCGSCHDPHGNGNYRILKAIPSSSGTTPGQYIPDVSTKVYTTTNYWDVKDANDTNTATAIPPAGSPGSGDFIANIAAWCSTCHTRYLAGTYAGSPSPGKTSSGDPIYTYRHRSDKVTVGTHGSPNCIQCHVAHGSNADTSGTNSSNVNWPGGSSGGTDSRLLRIDNRGTCQMCHQK